MPKTTQLMTQQEIIGAISACAEKLERVPTLADMIGTTKVTQRMIVKQFGSFTRALRACGLERISGGTRLTIETLFEDWANVVRTIQKIPNHAEYAALAKHSDRPLRSRFGSWARVPLAMRNYIEKAARMEECKDLLEIIDQFEREQKGSRWSELPVSVVRKPGLIPGRPVYGPLLRPFPAMHGPTEEQGVVYLFGTMSERLGFVVLHIQKPFPDCEALREVEEGMWQRVIIEFEYESLNFVKHGHDASKCDIIVCWKHNWPECPLEVVELSKEINSFNHRGHEGNTEGRR